MKATRLCEECRVPSGVARTMDWNPDGTITQRKDPAHRLIFFESDNLDRLWSGLSERLDVTREHVAELVIESKSQATRAFLYRTLPWYVNFLARFIGYRSMISRIESQGLVMGYGKITVGGQYPERGRPERLTVLVEDPYSLPLFIGDFKGAAEVLEKRSADITYQALDARRHQVDVTMREKRLEEESFELTREHSRKAGDFEYERCPSCGAPRDLEKFEWDTETGIIREKETERRMALFGTAGLLAVFDKLTHELGERVVDAVIDIERENTLSAMSLGEVQGGYEGLRYRAALRGLGLITSLELNQAGMSVRMANPAIPAYIVGLALGAFELALHRRGGYYWNIEDDGDLAIDITPV